MKEPWKLKGRELKHAVELEQERLFRLGDPRWWDVWDPPLYDGPPTGVIPRRFKRG